MNESVRLMVVDDSPSTRTMLREALALDGGIDVVAEAGTGREAISRASEFFPDVSSWMFACRMAMESRLRGPS
jgi:chemotaxis response regulator CheB